MSSMVEQPINRMSSTWHGANEFTIKVLLSTLNTSRYGGSGRSLKSDATATRNWMTHVDAFRDTFSLAHDYSDCYTKRKMFLLWIICE